MDPVKTAAIWKRLTAGKSLDDLGVARVGGRLDLRGIVAPAPSFGRKVASPRGHVAELTNLVVLRGVSWNGLDFSGAKLGSLRFFDSVIDDCRFESANCRDWRMWGTRVRDTSFRGADLREAALGGVDEGRRNSFQRVDFSKANLRDSAHKSSDMEQCQFDGVSGVDFQGTVFKNCTFIGELNDVLFYRHAFRGEAYPANEMKGVDFRGATLRHVGFRRLDMDDVKWPTGGDHVVLSDYVATLERVQRVLSARTDEGTRRIGVLIAHSLRWAGPNQKEGVINIRDWSEVCGEEVVAEFLALARLH
jgi:uncharacterized protein YjbI with pentapeptide repeats